MLESRASGGWYRLACSCLNLVLETEVGVLEGRRYSSRLKLSVLPNHKTLDEFDVSFQHRTGPQRLVELRSPRFIERRVCILLLGPPGVGKSHIAVRLAMDAPRTGYLVNTLGLDTELRRRRAIAHRSRRSMAANPCSRVGTLEAAPSRRFRVNGSGANITPSSSQPKSRY
jgi:hypothetical protein